MFKLISWKPSPEDSFKLGTQSVLGNSGQSWGKRFKVLKLGTQSVLCNSGQSWVRGLIKDSILGFVVSLETLTS